MSARPTRRAIVLIDHGSRRAEANRLLGDIAERMRERLPERIVEIAHLEVEPPTLADAVESCVDAGAAEIVVQPCFLAPGRHSRQDIPRLADEARARHPGLRLRVGQPLGAHPGLVEALLDRIQDCESADD